MFEYVVIKLVKNKNINCYLNNEIVLNVIRIICNFYFINLCIILIYDKESNYFIRFFLVIFNIIF